MCQCYLKCYLTLSFLFIEEEFLSHFVSSINQKTNVSLKEEKGSRGSWPLEHSGHCWAVVNVCVSIHFDDGISRPLWITCAISIEWLYVLCYLFPPLSLHGFNISELILSSVESQEVVYSSIQLQLKPW